MDFSGKVFTTKLAILNNKLAMSEYGIDLVAGLKCVSIQF